MDKGVCLFPTFFHVFPNDLFFPFFSTQVWLTVLCFCVFWLLSFILFLALSGCCFPVRPFSSRSVSVLYRTLTFTLTCVPPSLCLRRYFSLQLSLSLSFSLFLSLSLSLPLSLSLSLSLAQYPNPLTHFSFVHLAASLCSLAAVHNYSEYPARANASRHTSNNSSQ